jgi:hypothetical protein
MSHPSDQYFLSRIKSKPILGEDMKRYKFETLLLVLFFMTNVLHAQYDSGLPLIGDLITAWGYVERIEIQDDVAYLSTRNAGLQVVDLSNRVEPEYLGYYCDPFWRIGEYTINGQYAYLLEYGGGSMRIVDLSDLNNPVQLGTLSYWNASFADVKISGDYAFLVDFGAGLVVVNISNPESPEIVWTSDEYLFSESIYLLDNYAFIASDNLLVFDISNPEEPTLVDSCETPGWSWFVTVSGNFAYMTDYDDLQDVTRLLIIDVSDPENPELRGSCTVPDVNRLFVSNNFIYIPHYPGVLILDVSVPDHPEEIAVIEAENMIEDVAVLDTIAYVADRAECLRMFNVINPEDPHYVRSYDRNFVNKGLVVQDSIAYISGSGGLMIVDLSTPEDPREMSILETPGSAEKLVIDGQNVYIADGTGGLYIVDVSNPYTPEELCQFDAPDSALDIAISGDFAFIADGERGLIAIDISDPEHPIELDCAEFVGKACSVALCDSIAYVADYDHGVRAFNISDPTNLEEIGIYVTRYHPECVETYQGYCFALAFQLYVLNVNDAGNLEVVGEEQAGGHCISFMNSFGFFGTHMCLSVIDISDPRQPQVVHGYHYTYSNPADVAIMGDYVVFADAVGLYIFDPDEEFGVKNNYRIEPNKLILYPSYPNPFNSTTTIVFHLPIPSPVNLTVHDIAGRQVAVLYDGWRGAGENRLSFNPEGLPAGVYLLSLSAGDIKLTQKVALLK